MRSGDLWSIMFVLVGLAELMQGCLQTQTRNQIPNSRTLTVILERTTKSFDKSRLSYKMREMWWETSSRSIKASMDSSSPRKRHVDFTNLHPFVPEGKSSQRHQDNIEGRKALGIGMGMDNTAVSSLWC